jgi:dihydroxyacetone kinase-like protein
MDGATIIRWLSLLAEAIHARRDELTELDAAIGDADHGINMDRGFAAVATLLPEWAGQDCGAILTATARVLISTVGGASGPLYGTAFLRAGAALAGKATITGPDLLAALEAALAGIAARGRATAGEKTMLDAWTPAMAAFRAGIEAGKPLSDAAQAAAAAAEDGARATIPLTATKGRAANLGPRSVGHQDPGATSSAVLFRTLAEALI